MRVPNEHNGCSCHISIDHRNDQSRAVALLPAGIYSVIRLLHAGTTCMSLSSPPTGIGLRPVRWHSKGKTSASCLGGNVGSHDGSCNPRMSATCAPSLTEKILINNKSPCHINIVDRNDHSHSMRPQRIHHSDDDGDCDSNSANDADVDDDNDDGGKQQRKQMQQQHSSPATKTTRFATTPMRATAPPFVPKSQHQPAARTVLGLRGDNKQTERPSGGQ